MSEVTEFQISASLVLYRNEPRQIATVLDSFFSSPLRLSLTAVDNSPTDELRSSVKARGAEYIWLGKNLGFGSGHNVAIRKYLSRSDYHLVVNPDVRFGSEVLPTLHEFMQHDPTIGLVMPRVLYPDGREQRLCKLLPSPLDLIGRRFGRKSSSLPARGRLKRYTLDDVDLSRARVVPSLSGCFMLLRNEALQRIGGFDERFFMYMEDVDLCRRFGQSSKTVFYPHVSIYHEYEKGSYRDVRLLQYHLRSAIKYFNKWGWICDAERSRANRQILQEETYQEQQAAPA